VGSAPYRERVAVPPKSDSTTISTAAPAELNVEKGMAGLLTDLSCRPTRRMLRLAVQGLLGTWGDVEESQLRVSSASGGEDEYVE